jgi:large subunit ribosomal protein L23
MDTNNLSKIILMPHVSEKSVMIADNVKQQTFKVAANATKKDVKEAIEKLFEVDVVNVNILSVTGKKKVFGRTIGKRKNYKKAYVTLKEGQDIDLGGES